MKILIDADGCPVVDIAVNLSRQYQKECLILCDTAHEIRREGVKTLVFDKGADSVDFAIANRVKPGDVVITQDYGLASMCLAKKAQVLHQDGWCYTEENVDALLNARYEAKRYRAAGGRTKGPAKRKAIQDRAFEKAFRQLLQQTVQG